MIRMFFFFWSLVFTAKQSQLGDTRIIMSNEIKPPNIDSVNKSSIPRKPFRLRQTITKISNSKAVKCQSSIQLKAGSVRDNSGVCAVADSESDKTCIFEKSKYSEELEMSGRKPSVGDRRSVESLGILSPNQMKDFSWIDDGSDPGSSRPRFRLGQELVLATWLQSPSNQQSASRVNPDRRSVESLGILTPNQIKDFSWINSTPKPIFEETPPDLLNFCTPGTKATRMSFSPKKIKIDKSMNATFSKDTKAKLENTYSIDSNSTIDRKNSAAQCCK
ncbi:uncharacterized protein LOC136040606 isoform X1 [Artemia franciscana]|uniref:uncharacterized protein LOC136040606 isoform X1 n=2 Tax=Artemia franciscana TaxID=6661 RepID=UPI0032DA4067